jgi:hypothetical protein
MTEQTFIYALQECFTLIVALPSHETHYWSTEHCADPLYRISISCHEICKLQVEIY